MTTSPTVAIVVDVDGSLQSRAGRVRRPRGRTQAHSIAGLAFDGDGCAYSGDADSPAGSASTHRLPGGDDGSEQLRRP
jgi:hypothetical protein